MLSLIVAAAVAAAPAGAPVKAKANNADAPIKLAAPQLSVLNMDSRAGEFFNEHIAEALTAEGFAVTTAKEIQALMGMERQKSLMGCDESNACLAELANALGVDAIATGEIGRFGDRYQVLIKVNSSSDGRQLSSYSARVSGEEAILDEIVKAAQSIGPEVAKKLGRKLHGTRKLRSGPTMRDYAWFPAGLGLVLGGGGGVLMFQAVSLHASLATGNTTMTLAQAASARDTGALFNALGLVGIGLGAGALLAGGGMFLLGGATDGKPDITASATMLPGGFAIGFSGVLP